jgi:hypothetical protein
MSTIHVFQRPDSRVLHDGRSAQATWMPAAILRLFRAGRERGRHSRDLPMDHDRGLVFTTFFAFDMRRLVGGGRFEQRDDRR